MFLIDHHENPISFLPRKVYHLFLWYEANQMHHCNQVHVTSVALVRLCKEFQF